VLWDAAVVDAAIGRAVGLDAAVIGAAVGRLRFFLTWCRPVCLLRMLLRGLAPLWLRGLLVLLLLLCRLVLLLLLCRLVRLLLMRLPLLPPLFMLLGVGRSKGSEEQTQCPCADS
jgi:hypothetical protein